MSLLRKVPSKSMTSGTSIGTAVLSSMTVLMPPASHTLCSACCVRNCEDELRIKVHSGDSRRVPLDQRVRRNVGIYNRIGPDDASTTDCNVPHNHSAGTNIDVVFDCWLCIQV